MGLLEAWAMDRVTIRNFAESYARALRRCQGGEGG